MPARPNVTPSLTTITLRRASEHIGVRFPNRMSIRTTRKIVQFSNPFSIEGVGRVLPAGNYEVVTDEELIEGQFTLLS